jgi:hypothetical protein
MKTFVRAITLTSDSETYHQVPRPRGCEPLRLRNYVLRIPCPLRLEFWDDDKDGMTRSEQALTA